MRLGHDVELKEPGHNSFVHQLFFGDGVDVSPGDGWKRGAATVVMCVGAVFLGYGIYGMCCEFSAPGKCHLIE